VYIFVEQGERVLEVKAVFFWYFLFFTTKKQGIRPKQGERFLEVKAFFFGISCFSQQRNREYDPKGFLCMRVCVCVRVWESCRHYAKRAFLMAVHSLTFQDDCRIIWPVFWS